MKIRAGFISNSSSSSFIINKKDISAHQAELIKRHYEISNMDYPPYVRNDDKREQSYYLHYEKTCMESDIWNIYDDEDTIEGYTILDNFSMKNYLYRIGIDDNIVEWRE